MARQGAVVVLLLVVSFSWLCCTTAGGQEAGDSSPRREHRGEELIGPRPTPERVSGGEAFATLHSVGQEVLNDIEYVITSPLRMDRKSALVAGGVGLTIGGLMVVDKSIQRAFQENRTDTNDEIADTLEEIGFGRNVLMANVGLIGAGWLLREHEAGNKLTRTALVSLEAQLFTEPLVGLTKFAVGRARPDAGEGTQSYDPFEGFDKSFPSSHAARTFAVAAVFADAYPQPIPFLVYTGAALISLSRIYLNEHFASDVFAGAALGFAIGKALSWRHQHPDALRGWSVLPFVPDARGGLGLTVEYRF
ncbi:MAG: phosphatase PAP2 family protein [Nitrospiraceae bacterium]